jgi:hypothetical protein
MTSASPSPRRRSYRHPAPQPTIAQLHECFRCDAASGRLYWKHRPASHFVSDHASLAFNAKFAGREAIVTPHPAGYRSGRLTFEGVKYCIRRSRVIWAMTYGAWPELDIGHRNQDFGDDRIENLRQQTESQRAAYTRMSAGRSGVRGVLLNDTGGYVATISTHRRPRYLGTFRRLADAVDARNAAAAALHGEFARMSEPPAQVAHVAA